MFIGGLQRDLDRPAAEESAFLALKEELLGYLNRFMKELVYATYRISHSLQKLEAKGVAPLLEAGAGAQVQRLGGPSYHLVTTRGCSEHQARHIVL
jgi:hypothetical protein